MGVATPPSGCPAVAVDASSNIYLAGSTTSTNFPLTPQPATDPPPAAFQSLLAAPPDVFVTKLNSAGNAIVFSTYLGGDGADTSAGVAVDSAFNVVVAGTTTSSNFPGQHFGVSGHSGQCERARIREQAGCDGQRSALLDLSFRQWLRNCSRSCGRPQKQDLRDWRHHVHRSAGRDSFVSRNARCDSGRLAGDVPIFREQA